MAEQDVIDAYVQEGNWDDVNSLFVLIATFLEEKTKISLKTTSPKKKGKKKV